MPDRRRARPRPAARHGLARPSPVRPIPARHGLARHRGGPLGAVLLIAALLGASLLGVGPVAAAPVGASPAASCRPLSFPVTLAGAPRPFALRGTLCVPPRPRPVLLVLVPGYTYGRAYWDFPYEPARYGFVPALHAAGYPTVSLDRLGTGRSSHPPARWLTFDHQVEALHQVAAALRSGTVTGTARNRLVLVGHSLGSGMVLADQVLHADADGLILTGFSHVINLVGSGLFEGAATYPASLDARFAGRPSEYLTTVPGTRAALFYAPGTYDPGVVATDERTKETTVNLVEAAGLATGRGMAHSTVVTVPVLVAAGELDTIACGTAECMAAEPAHYGRPDLVTTLSVAGTGHNLNLSRTAGQFFAAVIRWLDRAHPDGS